MSEPRYKAGAYGIVRNDGKFIAHCTIEVDDACQLVRHANQRDALLAACKLALGAFEHNHAIDWSVLENAIADAECEP